MSCISTASSMSFRLLCLLWAARVASRVLMMNKEQIVRTTSSTSCALSGHVPSRHVSLTLLSADTAASVSHNKPYSFTTSQWENNNHKIPDLTTLACQPLPLNFTRLTLPLPLSERVIQK